MNYSIQYQRTPHPYMTVSPRKKRIKNTLLMVHSGTVLIKVGKSEYALKANDLFWLPIGSLTSITYFPHAETSNIDFSVRLKETFPSKAGYITPSALTQACIDKLYHQDIGEQYRLDLLQILKHECQIIAPSLFVSKTSAQFNQWTVDSNQGLSQELHMALTIRYARKQLLSGGSRQQVVDTLFSGSHSAFDQIWQSVMGQENSSK